MLAEAGRRQQARMRAKGKSGGGAAGGVGQHHRGKGPGMMAPVDLPARREMLDAQVPIKPTCPTQPLCLSACYQ